MSAIIDRDAISARLTELSKETLAVGEIMRYYGGFGQLSECGGDLVGIGGSMAHLAALIKNGQAATAADDPLGR